MHLNSTDLVSNIHPMEICSALLLRIMCARVFLAHKCFHFFGQAIACIRDVSGMSPIASHWK